MLFLSDLSRQESDKHTTSQQGFDVTEFRKGHGRYVSQTTITRWRHVNQMCWTRYRTAFQSTRRFPNQEVSRFSECAKEPNKGLALLRVRGILELQIETDKLQFLAEFTKLVRCDVIRNNTNG